MPPYVVLPNVHRVIFYGTPCVFTLFCDKMSQMDFLTFMLLFDRLTFELCVLNEVYFKHTDFTVDGALTHVHCRLQS